MPKLDLRLKTVAQQIRSRVHIDIGSDHGHLLVALLKSGRIERGIAVENKRQPFENSRAALAGFSAEARLGDGLQPIEVGEAESLSICGMGAESIVTILKAHPDRVPSRVVIQPNRNSELVRRWAFETGFHFVSEHTAKGHWHYAIMTFQRSLETKDPAYEDLHRDAALMFGPLVLKQCDASFLNRLREEQAYLMKLDSLGYESSERLELIRLVLRGDHTGH